jgi:ApbE superfamily uncharacterized protein (UPF0280 family)
MYQERFYRNWMGRDGIDGFRIVVGQSDLFVQSDRLDSREPALAALKHVRKEIEDYISSHGFFREALTPIPVSRKAPKTIKIMAQAARTWDVGPMAAVAGAVAEFVGKGIETNARTVIVENGGDIYAKDERALRFALWAGEESPFKDKIAFEVDARDGVGVCTSSGKVGPSLSFGNADAVVAIADDAACADAAATAIANGIRVPEDVAAAIEEQKKKGALRGVIACLGDRLGIWGDIEIIKR